MKQIFFMLGVVLFPLLIHAQDLPFRSPDYDSIRMKIEDASSPYFYPKLMSRWIALDTSLIPEDYRCLYYGYTFQPAYDPYWRSPDEEKLAGFFLKQELQNNDYEEIVRLVSHSLGGFPFDLKQMNLLAYATQMKGDTLRARKIRDQFGQLVRAIMSSGDGKTCATGIHVIAVSHEYVILKLFQFEFKSQSLTPDLCDYLHVIKDKRAVDGIYFNIKKLWDVNVARLKSRTMKQ